MRKKTERFTNVREERTVLGLSAANYTFINERTAEHYGFNRTSPVLRGKWVMKVPARHAAVSASVRGAHQIRPKTPKTAPPPSVERYDVADHQHVRPRLGRGWYRPQSSSKTVENRVSASRRRHR